MPDTDASAMEQDKPEATEDVKKDTEKQTDTNEPDAQPEAAIANAEPTATKEEEQAAATKEEQATDDDNGLPPIAATITNLEKARTRVKKAFARSKLLNAEQDHLYPRFEWTEITTGEVLGVGGFGTVKEIEAIELSKTKKSGPDSSFSFRSWAELTGNNASPVQGSGAAAAVPSLSLPASVPEDVHKDEEDDEVIDDDDDEDDVYYDECFQDKRFICENTKRRGGSARYAIKFISPHVKQDPKLFLQAAMDMAVETQFLSVLQHEHLVRMRGVGQGDMFDAEYFLVLDRLYDTLEDRIDTWKEYAKDIAGKGLFCKLRKFPEKRKAHFQERLKVCRDLASALSYLHDLSIIYRDFKPDNIGFDVRGVVKLFDFGLAKELHPDDRKPNGTWRLTGETGAIRYMAPEIATRHPYNFSADVYSFAIVLWESMALQVPYAGFNKYQMTNIVASYGERPSIDDKKWPKPLIDLIQKCWDANHRKRPLCATVVKELEKLIDDE